MTTKLTVALLVLITFLPAAAYSSTPAEDFVDDQLLSQATVEIDLMNAEQLDAFIEYLSVWGASAEAPDKELMCEVATTRFQLKNAAAAALSKLVDSLAIHSHMVSRQWEGATEAERTRLGKYIQRSADIYRVLEKGAAVRYIDLTHERGKKGERPGT